MYIDRARLRHMLEEGTPRASALMRLLDEPSSSLSTILFVHTLALCAGAAAAFWFDLRHLDHDHGAVAGDRAGLVSSWSCCCWRNSWVGCWRWPDRSRSH